MCRLVRVCAVPHQAVCSTSNDKAVTNLVKTLMGKERLERIKIFAGDIVEKKKPNPDIYNLAKVCVRWCLFLCSRNRIRMFRG